MLVLWLVPLVIPVFLLGAIACAIPIVAKLVVDVVGKKVPRRYKPAAAAVVGVAAGAIGHAAGLDARTAAELGGLAGLGSVAVHEGFEMARGRRYKKPPTGVTDPAGDRK